MEMAISAIERLILRIAVLCVIVIVLTVSVDAVSRYAIHHPLPWSFDLISYYLLIAALYFALSPTFQSGDHINIDLFRNMMPKRLRTGLDVIWGLLAATAFGLIAFGAAEEMIKSYANHEFLPGYIAWPAWASYPAIVIGAGTLTLRLLLHCFKLAVHGEDKGVADSSGEHFE